MILPMAHLSPTAFDPWRDGMARLMLEITEPLLEGHSSLDSNEGG